MVKKKTENIIDLITGHELLILFRQYVDECIAETDKRTVPEEVRRGEVNIVRPKSFDEWYNTQYLPHLNKLTQVVRLVTVCERPLRHGNFLARIPRGIVNDKGFLIDPQRLLHLCRFVEQSIYQVRVLQ